MHRLGPHGVGGGDKVRSAPSLRPGDPMGEAGPVKSRRRGHPLGTPRRRRQRGGFRHSTPRRREGSGRARRIRPGPPRSAAPGRCAGTSAPWGNCARCHQTVSPSPLGQEVFVQLGVGPDQGGGRDEHYGSHKEHGSPCIYVSLHCKTPIPAGGVDQAGDLLGGAVEAVVDHLHRPQGRCARSFLGRLGQALADPRRGITPLAQPALLLGGRRRHHEDQERVREAPVDLARSLHQGVAAGRGDRRPVEVPQELGPLQELARFDRRLEASPVDKDVGIWGPRPGGAVSWSRTGSATAGPSGPGPETGGVALVVEVAGPGCPRPRSA